MTATLSSKGQIVIPKEIRDRLNLKPGTKLDLDVQGEKVVLKRVVPEYSDWRTMRGMLKTDDGVSLVDLMMEDTAFELEREEAKFASLFKKSS